MRDELFQPQTYKRPTATGLGLYYDPVYGYVPLPPKIRRAMDLPTMERLRHVSQLSTVELVFPGATHNRLEHSVGVYRLASLIMDSIAEKEREKAIRGQEHLGLSPASKLAVELAALFHDVGHGPYSHVFELFCRRNPDYSQHDHQRFTERLIAEGVGQYADIPVFLRGVYDEIQKSPQIFQEWKGEADLLSPKSIAAIAVGKFPLAKPEYSFLGEIVSHVTADADRMDYLVRDSQHCNVHTGGADIWEIVHSYTIVPEFISGRKFWKLKINRRATKAVEALLSARDLAYRIVYYNSTHRIAQEMMIAALYELTETKKDLTAEEIALFTDGELLLAFSQGTAFTKDVAKRIFYRALYEPLPFRINVMRDLDINAQQKVLDLAHPKDKSEYEQRSLCAMKASNELKLPSDQRVIFDLEPVPVTSISAYTEPVLYDEATGVSSSLFDELRHLKHSHGQLEFGDERLDMHARYIRECTELQMAIPFEFIDSCVEELQETVNKHINNSEPKVDSGVVKRPAKKKRSTNREAQQGLFSAVQTAKASAQEISTRRLGPVFNAFMDVLDIQDVDNRNKLMVKFNTNMTYYLLRSVRTRLVIDIPSLTTIFDDELKHLSRPTT